MSQKRQLFSAADSRFLPLFLSQESSRGTELCGAWRDPIWQTWVGSGSGQCKIPNPFREGCGVGLLLPLQRALEDVVQLDSPLPLVWIQAWEPWLRSRETTPLPGAGGEG